MNKWISAIVSGCLLVGIVAMPASAQLATADKNPPSTAQLEIRANQAFNRGEYVAALPLLRNLADTFKSQPTRLGPIQERIRVCEKAIEVAKKEGPTTKPVDALASAEVRKPHPAPKPGEILDFQIKDLGNFDYDQEHGGNIPADIRGLSGAKVRLHGFMIPMDQAENITQFALVPSLFACCFGQPPQIQHTIVASTPKGKAVGYVPDEIVVEGNLKVQEKKDDGYVVSIFEMDVTSVKPAPR